MSNVRQSKKSAGTLEAIPALPLVQVAALEPPFEDTAARFKLPPELEPLPP